MSEISKMFDKPETILSPQTGHVYTVIATKNGARLAIKCEAVKAVSITGDASLGLVVRFIELRQQFAHGDPEFTAFPFVTESLYSFPLAAGKELEEPEEVELFRGAKFYAPVASYPCGPKELAALLDSQAVFQTITDWFCNRIKDSGGVLAISPTTLQLLVGGSWDAYLVDDAKPLFKMPVVPAQPKYPFGE